MSSFYIGFDLGTSGARISIIEKNNFLEQKYVQIYADSVNYEKYDDHLSWKDAIDDLLKNSPSNLLQKAEAICISGTSGSCLIVDERNGRVTRQPKMYDYDISHSRSDTDPVAYIRSMEWLDQFAPPNHTTRATTSALSKLLHYHACSRLQKHEILAHQSEYIANSMFMSTQICGAGDHKNRRVYISDWHNALKLGYDVKQLQYPAWLLKCLDEIGLDAKKILPSVVSPGQMIGRISESSSIKYGINPECVIVGGTTDSNAAFIAAVASSGNLPSYGVAVTSLGSTLAIKILSKTFVEDSSTGVYSHRFPDISNSNNKGEVAWLVGGASNVGCAVLRQEGFSNEELIELSKDMDISSESAFNYYPLTKRGERFPVADATKEPILEPKVENRLEYLKAIFQGIANVEKRGFQVLADLGCDPPVPTIVHTCGGGARNDKWNQMRHRILERSFDNNKVSIKVLCSENAEASYGAAILAATGKSRYMKE